MNKRPFRFKREFFEINGQHNIPGLVISSGHGYDFRTYCCKFCGEIFVVDFELIHGQEEGLFGIVAEKNCPQCKSSLASTLVAYPENLYFKGTLMINENSINKAFFSDTELVEVYEIEE